MRDYGKVHTSFWSSSTIGSLSEDGRTLALYLLTSPHTTIAGVMRLPDGYVCEDLRWGSERVSEGFAELFRKGFANRCETTKWVWICKHFEWNQPENPNQRKAAAKVAQSIPDECGWKPDFIRVCGHLLGISSGPFANGSETLSKPFRNQKQEQKQKESMPPPLATADEGDPPTEKADPRGTRLPADWALTPELLEIGRRARADAGLPAIDLRLEAAKFVDFWRAKSGRDATKLDWPATWRNWCRNATAGKGAPARGADPVFKTPAEVGL